MSRLTPKMMGLLQVKGELQPLCRGHRGVVVAVTKTCGGIGDWESRNEDPMGHYTNTHG